MLAPLFLPVYQMYLRLFGRPLAASELDLARCIGVYRSAAAMPLLVLAANLSLHLERSHTSSTIVAANACT